MPIAFELAARITSEGKLNLRFRFPHRRFVFRQDLVHKSVNIRRLRTPGYPENRHQAYFLLQNPAKSVGTPTSSHELITFSTSHGARETPILSWKHLIDVHQKLIFKGGKSR